MKRISIAPICWRCLLAVAIVLGTYHSLYGLVDRHYAIPVRFHYGEFVLIALYIVVVATGIACSLLDRDFRPKFLAEVRGSKLWCLALAALFFVVIFLSAVLLERERQGSFLYSIGCLADMGVHVFVLFPLGLWFGSKADRRLLNNLFDLLLLIYLAIVLYSLYGIHFGREVVIGGAPVQLGYGYRLCIGILNPNDTGMFCVLMMSIGLYRILTGSRIAKGLHSFATVVFYVCLVLTDSRSGLLAISFGFGTYTGVCWWHKHMCKSLFWRLLSATMAGGVVALVLFLGRFVVMVVRPFTAVTMILVAIALLCQCKKIMTRRFLLCAGGVAVVAAVMIGIYYGSALLHVLASVPTRIDSSGRLRLWLIVIDLLRENSAYLLRGCGPLFISEKIGPIYGIAFTTHNQFLEIALGYGLPSLVFFLAWLVNVARHSWHIVKAPCTSADLGQKFLPFILLILLTNNMFENCLLFYRFVMGSVFFLVAGYVCSGGDSTMMGYHIESVGSNKHPSTK